MASAYFILPDHGGRDYSPSPEEEIKFKVTGDESDGQCDYFDLSVGYLKGFPLHIHLQQHETFHIIEGELIMQLGDELVSVKKGEFVFIPKGLLHTYVNVRKEPARVVGNLSPGGFHKFLEEMIPLMRESGGRPDPKKYQEICDRHAQKQTGSPLAIVFGLIPDPTKEAAVKQELENLQGDWTQVAGEAHGAKQTEEDMKQRPGVLTIDGNKMRNYVKDREDFEGIIKFDPTQTPKTVDCLLLSGPGKGKTGLGIYELNGDDLRICWAIAGLKEGRPTEFSARSGENQAMPTYKRRTR
jgi:uncharacterized protein (TIGR03067 family)